MSSVDIVPTVTQIGESSYFSLPDQKLGTHHVSNVLPRKNTSPAWRYFERIDKLVACCKLCGLHVPIKHGSTAGLFSHLKNKHPFNYQTVKGDTLACVKPKIIKSDLSHLIPETSIKIEEKSIRTLISTKPQDSILEFISNCRNNDHSFCDVAFHCKDGEVHAHRIILASASQYLKYIFMISDQEEQHILMNDFTCELVSNFLDDLYTGKDFLKYEDIASSLLLLKPIEIKHWKVKKTIPEDMNFDNFTPTDNDDDIGVKLEASASGDSENEDMEVSKENSTNLKNISGGKQDTGYSGHVEPYESVIKEPLKPPKLKGTKKKRSQVWRHFSKDGADHSTCTCHHCHRQVASHGGSTSAMMKHLVINHPEVLDLKEIPDKYKQLPPDEVHKSALTVKNSNVTPDQITSCKFCGQDLGSSDLAVIHHHMFLEHTEQWIKEGNDLGLLVREKSERPELCFMMGEIENNMVCKLCQTVVTKSEMTEHLRGEHKEVQPILSIYFKVEEDSFAKCDICGTANLDLNDIDSHMEGHHAEVYERICVLRKILSIDSKDMNVEDRVCLEIFAKHIDILDPIVSKVDSSIDTKLKVKTELPYKLSADGKTCGDCGKVYVSRSSCRLHWRAVHSGLRPFECEKCGNTFTRKDSYDSHMTMHENSQPFMCSECGKTFNRRHARDQHERAHRGDFRFACSFCGRKFLSGQQMRGHERTHTGEKPFQCSQCGRQFVQKHQLVTHFRTHTGEKPYQCNKCKQWFKHLSSRRNHKCEPVDPVLIEGAGSNKLEASDRHRLEMMEKMKQHFGNAAAISDPILRLSSFHHPEFK